MSQEKKYVPSTIKDLSKVLEDARNVYDDKDASQDEINKALKALVDEILKARLLGDVNFDGSVTALDASEILKDQAELKDLEKEQKEAGDVNFDEKCDGSDASKILQLCAEKIDSFQ